MVVVLAVYQSLLLQLVLLFLLLWSMYFDAVACTNWLANNECCTCCQTLNIITLISFLSVCISIYICMPYVCIYLHLHPQGYMTPLKHSHKRLCTLFFFVTSGNQQYIIALYIAKLNNNIPKTNQKNKMLAISIVVKGTNLRR